MEPVLLLDNVSKTVERQLVLKSISLEVARGAMILVRGRSGVGKTTLAEIAALLLRPDTGRVLYRGRDAWSISGGEREALRIREIGYVDQYYTLIDSLTVYENVELPLRLTGVPRNERKSRALTALRELGLSGLEDRLPGQLSGGQKQRVAIARALAKNPLLFVGDEPFSNLDDETMGLVVSVLRERARRDGVAVLVTTTDLTRSYGFDQDYLLEAGALTPFHNPRLNTGG